MKVFDVRDLPFNQSGTTEDFRLLMPLETSGSVASFTFDATFTPSVPK
jgi:hypothetical protein